MKRSIVLVLVLLGCRNPISPQAPSAVPPATPEPTEVVVSMLEPPVIEGASGEPVACGPPVPLYLHHFTGLEPLSVTCSPGGCRATPHTCEPGYCEAAGFPVGTECCPVRPAGHPELDACNLALLGGPAEWHSDGVLSHPWGHLSARCDTRCTYLEVCNISGTVCNHKNF